MPGVLLEAESARELKSLMPLLRELGGKINRQLGPIVTRGLRDKSIRIIKITSGTATSNGLYPSTLRDVLPDHATYTEATYADCYAHDFTGNFSPQTNDYFLAMLIAGSVTDTSYSNPAPVYALLALIDSPSIADSHTQSFGLWQYNESADTTPASGVFDFDTTGDPASATEMYVNTSNLASRDMGFWLAKAISVALCEYGTANPERWFRAAITAVSLSGGVYTFTLSNVVVGSGSNVPTNLNDYNLFLEWTPLTTKGDILTFGNNAERKAVGSDDTLIRARSSDSQGWEWFSISSLTEETQPVNGDHVLMEEAGGALRRVAATPLTTKGDLGVFTTFATRLGVGSDGQVLTAASGQASGMEWATPSTSSPLTTKGDLFTFTTVDARLGVGSDDALLIADSAQATGLKWSKVSTLTEEAAPASGDWLCMEESGGALRKVDVASLVTLGIIRVGPFTLSHTDFQVAAASNNVEIFAMPAARSVILAQFKLDTAFAGGGQTYNLDSIGKAGDTARYYQGVGGTGFDLTATPGATIGDLHVGLVSNPPGDIDDQGSGTSVRAYVSSNGNLSNSTAGQITFWFLLGATPS